MATLLDIAMVGICVGFLLHNWHPAKLFMGDSGSMLLGYLITCASIVMTGRHDPATVSTAIYQPAFMPVLLPILVLVLPVLDMMMAIVRRLRKGQSPMHPDRMHLHHRMLRIGHSVRGAVLILTISIAITALLIVVSINAVNFVDGLDGLAAGIVAFGGIAFGIYSYILARTSASSASLAMLLEIVRRVRKGQSPMHPDRMHLHHRLLRIGHSVRGAVLILWGWAALIAFGSIMLLFFTAWHVFIVFAVAAVALTVATMSPYLNRLMHGTVEEIPYDELGETGGGERRRNGRAKHIRNA